MTPLLQVRDLQVRFHLRDRWGRRRTVRAVDGIDLDLEAGRTLGVVGESGCGKSSLARAILGLVPAAAGSVRLDGEELLGLPPRRLRPLRRRMQMVFQDPFAALDPRMTVGEIVTEPLKVFEPGLDRRARRRRAEELLQRVGLAPELHNRYPHEFSGGQAQRIGIARALAPDPALLVCDEPVSALDVSIQAQVINLLLDLQAETGLALLFIAHDLAVVRQVSHRVMVMYLGRAVEVADSRKLYARPLHPYTRLLLDAVPRPDPKLERSRPVPAPEGEPPSPLSPPPGCAFHPRCSRAGARCRTERPPLQALEGRLVACHHPLTDGRRSPGP